jgi:hypothetical protein
MRTSFNVCGGKRLSYEIHSGGLSTMSILQRVVLLLKVMVLGSLGMSAAWAQKPVQIDLQLAAADSQSQSRSWKDQGDSGSSKKKEANSGSWQPQSNSSDDDAENPDNDGEDSQTYDDGDT